MLGEADQRVHYCTRHLRPVRHLGPCPMVRRWILVTVLARTIRFGFILQTTYSVSLHTPLRRPNYTKVREHRTEPINLLLGSCNSSYEPPITSLHIHCQAGKEDDAPQEFGQ
jgi:hypothetical protein